MENELTFVQLQNCFAIHFLGSTILIKKRSGLSHFSVEKAVMDVDISTSIEFMTNIINYMIKHNIEMEIV